MKCGLDATARKVGGKAYDERDGEMNMSTEETEKQTEHDRKRQRLTIVNNNTTLALYVCNATTPVSKFTSQN